VFHGGEAANPGNLLRRKVQFTASLFYALRIGVHIIHADETGPGGFYASFEHLRGELHEAGDTEITNRKDGVRHASRITGALSLPSDDVSVELLSAFRVCSSQFVPDEISCSRLG